MARRSSYPPLTTKGAAEFLGCSESWLRHTRVRGSETPGPSYYRNGKAVRYTVEDLEEFRERNSVTAEAA